MPLQHESITEHILAACFAVRNELGAGFLETVYHNAMMIALTEKGLKAIKGYPLSVYYHEQVVGEFYADILVEGTVILELKAVTALTNVHKAQVINYLKATGIEVGMLVNFGANRLEYVRLHK